MILALLSTTFRSLFLNIIKMKSIVTISLALLPFAATLPEGSAKKGYGPRKVKCKTGKMYDIGCCFAVSVPTINYDGYPFAIPATQ
jgi:hypothetical protein